MKITEIVKETSAIFSHYKCGMMYYDVKRATGEWICTFPLDVTNVEDIGSATLESTHKAITLMRYIRKAIKDETIVFSAVSSATLESNEA
jgi:hypothetical protein